MGLQEEHPIMKLKHVKDEDGHQFDIQPAAQYKSKRVVHQSLELLDVTVWGQKDNDRGGYK